MSKPDGKKTEAGIVSVKAGEGLHVDMVRDLRGAMEREKAPFAVLITLREPTKPMMKEAASAGFFDTPFGRFPRIQIATVSELMDGKLPKLPPQEIGGGYASHTRGSRATHVALEIAGLGALGALLRRSKPARKI